MSMLCGTVGVELYEYGSNASSLVVSRWLQALISFILVPGGPQIYFVCTHSLFAYLRLSDKRSQKMKREDEKTASSSYFTIENREMRPRCENGNGLCVCIRWLFGEGVPGCLAHFGVYQREL